MATFSRIAILLLSMYGMCIFFESAFGAPPAANADVHTTTTPPSNQDALDDSNQQEVDVAAKKEGTLTAPAENALDAAAMESSQLSTLKTKKALRRQSNRLIKQRRARDAPADGEDTSNEDEPSGTQVNPRPHQRDLISCVSHPSNNTIPAAHIKGRGTKPFAHSTFESSKHVQGYQQRWQCCEYGSTPSHNPHAFVDGGMIFNQTDKTLRVPTCGYYHVFSQIYFKINQDSNVKHNNRSVYHLLKFERNCSSWPEFNPVTVLGKSAVATDDTTTYTSDIVRLCVGGKIWVEIPDFRSSRVPCCPIGDEQGTFIGAYLVAPTTCHWPPSISMENLNPDCD